MADLPSSPGRLPLRSGPAVRSALLLLILVGAASARVVAQVREPPDSARRVRLDASGLRTRIPLPASQDTPATVQRITVPDVTGLMLPEATERLAAAGLKVGPIDSVQTTDPPGSVVKQWPEPGSEVTRRLTARYVARLWLATASPQPVQEEPLVPDLSGRTLEEARRILEGVRLRVGKVSETPGTAPPGTVVGQGPPAGTRWQSGSGVDLELAVVAEVVVPDLVGKTPAEATAALAGLALSVARVDSVATPSGNGTVVSQAPAAGSRVAPGSGITLVQGIAPAPVALAIVPNILGDSVARARQRLASLGLGLAVAPGVGGGRAVGRVRAQRPSAGAHVPRGSVVEVQLEAAPAGRPSAGRILVPVLALAGLILLALGGWRAWKWWESRPAPPPKVPRPPKPESVARPPKPPAVQKPPKAPRPQPSPQGPMVELSTVWDLGHTVLECAGPLEAAPAIHLVARANLESREVTIEHAGTVVSAVRTGDPGLEQAAAASLEGGGTATFLHRRKVAQGSAAPADRGDDRESPTGGEHE